MRAQTAAKIGSLPCIKVFKKGILCYTSSIGICAGGNIPFLRIPENADDGYPQKVIYLKSLQQFLMFHTLIYITDIW